MLLLFHAGYKSSDYKALQAQNDLLMRSQTSDGGKKLIIIFRYESDWAEYWED